MNWDAAAAIGEILGAIAVIVTLGYLARQTRFLRSAAVDNSRLIRATGVRDMALAMSKDDAMRNSVAKSVGAAAHYEEFATQFGLSFDEAGRSDAWNVYWFWLHWGQYRAMLEPEDLEELANLIGLFYTIPSVGFSWDRSPFAKALLEPAFVQFVEGIISARSDPTG